MNKNKTIAGIWFGGVFIALGLGAMGLMAIQPDGLNVPMWVAQIGASAFVFAGISFVARAQNLEVLSRICSLCVVVILLALGVYFLFG